MTYEGFPRNNDSLPEPSEYEESVTVNRLQTTLEQEAKRDIMTRARIWVDQRLDGSFNAAIWEADSKSRNTTPEEEVKWTKVRTEAEKMKQEQLARELALYEELYDIDPALVDSADEASVTKFMSAALAYVQFERHDYDLANAKEILTATAGAMRALASPGEGDLMAGARAVKPFINKAYQYLVTLDDVHAKNDVLYNLTYGSSSLDSWQKAATTMQELLDGLKAENSPHKEVFIDRYKTGEPLSTLNAITPSLDASGMLKIARP